MFSTSFSLISRQEKRANSRKRNRQKYEDSYPSLTTTCCRTSNNSLGFSDAHLPYLEKQWGWAKAALRCLPDLKVKMLMAHSVLKTTCNASVKSLFLFFLLEISFSSLIRKLIHAHWGKKKYKGKKERQTTIIAPPRVRTTVNIFYLFFRWFFRLEEPAHAHKVFLKNTRSQYKCCL